MSGKEVGRVRETTTFIRKEGIMGEAVVGGRWSVVIYWQRRKSIHERAYSGWVAIQV